MDFEIKSSGSSDNNLVLAKASATVIEAGDLVALSSWLAIKAVAASTAVAYTEAGAGDGETEITVSADPELILKGTADANFAATNRGTEVDIVGTTTLLIDLGASTTDVLKVLPSANAGTVGATTDVLVKINKTL